LWVAENDFDNRISAGHAAFLNSSSYTRFGYTSFPTDGLYSKNWEEFAKPDAPVMDFVITVCDNAAGEVCPVWPGRPITAHWGVEDPSLFQGNDDAKSREFTRVASILKRRIELFTSLPLDKLDRLKLEKTVRDLGKP